MKHILPFVLGAAAIEGGGAGVAAPATPQANPNFIASPAALRARIPGQLHISKPDFIVFVPEVKDEGVSDTGKRTFLSVRRP